MSKPGNLHKSIAAIAGVGVALSFLGHGMWAAAEQSPKFVELITGSYKNVLGGDLDVSTATSWLQFIGTVDVFLAAILAIATVGIFAGKGRLNNLASSKLVVGIYAWAVLWGFVTAASRVTAAGAFYPEVWDWVERGPNFMLPLIGLIMVLHLRGHRKK